MINTDVDDDVRGLRITTHGCIVYVLICPLTKRVRYVGSTQQPKTRRYCHTRQIFEQPKTPVQAWTTELIENGTPPLFRIVSRVGGVGWRVRGGYVCQPEDMMRSIEKMIIKRCLLLGCDLLNVQCTRLVK
jgi:hypothetical protein